MAEEKKVAKKESFKKEIYKITKPKGTVVYREFTTKEEVKIEESRGNKVEKAGKKDE